MKHKRQLKMLFYLVVFIIAMGFFLLKTPAIIALLVAAWALTKVYRLSGEARWELEERHAADIYLVKLNREDRDVEIWIDK